MSEKKLTPAEEEEKKDLQKLTKLKTDIDEIMQLLADRQNRETSDEKVRLAQTNVDAGRQGSVFHNFKGKHVSVSQYAGDLLTLADALELKFKTARHARDLHKGLQNKTTTKISLLKKIIERQLKK